VDDLRLFTSEIEHFVGLSKVHKSVSIKAEITSQNETDFIVPAGLVEFDQVFSIVMVEYNYAFEVFGAEIKIKIT
jgi:hypothetical protein